MTKDNDWVSTWQSDDVERKASQDVAKTVYDTIDELPETYIKPNEVEGAIVVIYTDDGRWQVLDVTVKSIRKQVEEIAKAIYRLNEKLMGNDK